MIWWVRHGQSSWNAIGRLQGQELSPPLTDLGRSQAAWAADVLTDRGVAQILTSPAVRARQTAEILATRLGLSVIIEPLLLERGLDESVDSVRQRIKQLLSANHQHTVVVSHGDTIGLAVALLSGRPPTVPANASITSIDRRSGDVRVESP